MTQSNQMVVLTAFGNDFSALINETILPLAVSRLRGQLTMPKLVSVDTSDEAKKVGEIIRVKKPINLGEADVHGTGGSVASDLTAEEVDLRLDRHIYKEFKMSDREFTGMQPGAIPDALEEAVDVLARAVNTALFDLYKEVPSFSGDLESTNARDKKDIIQARKVLNNKKVLGDKNLVLTADTEADLLSILAVGVADGEAEREGNLGRRMGFDLYSDVQAPIHDAGTAAGQAGITLSATAIVGATALALSGAGNASTFIKGDILKIAGSTQVFTVAADTASDALGAAVVTVAQPVEVEIATGTAVDVVGDHNVDLAFAKSAFMIAFRQLQSPEFTPGTTIGSITDPETGITLRLLSWYKPETESTHWKLETLFGVKAVAPERAIRVGGH